MQRKQSIKNSFMRSCKPILQTLPRRIPTTTTNNPKITRTLYTTPYKMPSFHQRAFYPQETTFTNLFRLLDDFDSYQQVNPRAAKGAHGRLVASFNPRFDVRETETSYELHGELPGVEKKDLNIEFDDQNMTIHGRVERNYTSGTPPAGLLEQDNNKEVDEASAATETASHKASVADEDEEKARENGSGRATPAETVKEGAVARAAAPKQPAEKYWHQERSIGQFSRTFSFQTRIDESAVTAKLENGVLHVSVPKAAKPASRRIDIN